MRELDWQQADYDPIPCPDEDCGGYMVEMSESNYGADRDGNRGITISWLECPVCGLEGVE